MEVLDGYKFKSQGIWWTVRFTDDIENLGETDYDKQEILIRTTLTPDMKLSTFIHEIGHTLNTTIDHSLWDSLSMQIFSVLKDNEII